MLHGNIGPYSKSSQTLSKGHSVCRDPINFSMKCCLYCFVLFVCLFVCCLFLFYTKLNYFFHATVLNSSLFDLQ